MKISELQNELRSRNAILYLGGMLNVFLFVSILLFSFTDERMVLGISTWIKPMKFTFSFIIFLWTFAWILQYIPDKRKVRWISIGLFVCMLMEMIPITLQAARGVTSHYNVTSIFNLIVFQIMGLFIVLNTIIVIYTIIQFFRADVLLDYPMKIAIRGALIIFVSGAISGGLMIEHGGHTFGMSDGGKGLFFVNWSTSKGDMRVAHFFTLHALQIIPLSLLLMSRFFKPTAILSFSLVLIYLLVCVLLHVQAVAERPVIAL
jgi:hypothetical protein